MNYVKTIVIVDDDDNDDDSMIIMILFDDECELFFIFKMKYSCLFPACAGNVRS